jgi:hypothetical protein
MHGAQTLVTGSLTVDVANNSVVVIKRSNPDAVPTNGYNGRSQTKVEAAAKALKFHYTATWEVQRPPTPTPAPHQRGSTRHRQEMPRILRCERWAPVVMGGRRPTLRCPWQDTLGNALQLFPDLPHCTAQNGQGSVVNAPNDATPPRAWRPRSPLATSGCRRRTCGRSQLRP